MEQELKILKFCTGPPDNMNEIDVKPSLPGKRHQRRRLGASTLLRAAIPKQRAQGQGGEAWKARQSQGGVLPGRLWLHKNTQLAVWTKTILWE